MLFWIIQVSLMSFILIYLIHHLINFFKSTLTTPKIKDLLNSSTIKYKNIYEIINNNSQTSFSLQQREPKVSGNFVSSKKEVKWNEENSKPHFLSKLEDIEKNNLSMRDLLKLTLKENSLNTINPYSSLENYEFINNNNDDKNKGNQMKSELKNFLKSQLQGINS
jgi:hypothetical protein